MIVLDTDVLSGLMRSAPDPILVAWLDRQAPDSIWTTSTTVMRIELAIETLAAGHRRGTLEAAFENLLHEDLGQRVLAFDRQAAREAARLAAHLQREGRAIDAWDLQIAAIAIARRGLLASGNTKGFSNTGVGLVNPWRELH